MFDHQHTIRMYGLPDSEANQMMIISILIANELLGPQGKTWISLSHGKAITFHFARLRDLRRFEKRLDELEFGSPRNEACTCNVRPCSCFLCEEVGDVA